jgi:hypothetical protein
LSRPIAITLGASGGAAIMATVLEMVRPEGKPIVDALVHWGPLFVIVLVGMILTHNTVNNWGKRFVDAAISNATALQSMADAMQRISQREDERDRERELLFDHLAYTTQAILKGVEQLDGKVDSIQAEGCNKAGDCGPKAGGN